MACEIGIPSFEEVQNILSSLNAEVIRLLRKHSTTKRPYTPDYAAFSEEVAALIDPILRYADSEFHAGNVADATAGMIALRIIARIKWETQKEWQRHAKFKGPEHPKSTRAFTSYKLLMHFFGHAAGPESSVRSLIDLEYQLEHENDPDKQNKLKEKCEEKFKNTGSYSYLRAKEHLNRGEVRDALAVCEEGILNFPQLTQLYELRANRLLKNSPG